SPSRLGSSFFQWTEPSLHVQVSWAGRVNIKPGSDSRESVTVHWCSCLYCFQRASSNNWMQYARRMSTPAQEKNT
ncbi:TPA: hypothetical protein ACUAHS_005107, partial [Escherichia coli]